MRTTLTLALACALAFTGCITNMAGLKESLGGEDAANETIEPASTGTNVSTPNSPPVVQQRPPVARVSIFEPSGTLLYKSTFTAEDPAEMIMVPAATKLNLIAGDSEAVERGATLTGFAWTANGKPVEGARQASFEIKDPGLYKITLQVTDSNGKTDAQSVKVALMPEPYEVVTELAAGQLVGQEGDAPADVAWDLAAPEKPATVQSVKIVAEPPVTCDAVLELLDPTGASMGSADAAGIQDGDNTETLELASIPFGAYTIRLSPFTCVALDIPITVTVVLLPTIEGLEGGHGGHNH